MILRVKFGLTNSVIALKDDG